MAEAIPEILILGPERSGKSLLVRRLKLFVQGAPDEVITNTTRPTMGVERDIIEISSRKFVFKEVGSTMMTTWSSYLPHCSMLIFTIDSSNRVIFSVACCELMSCLVKLPKDIPVVIVFTHDDAPEQIKKWELECILRLEDLKASRGSIKTISINNINGHGIRNLIAEIALQ